MTIDSRLKNEANEVDRLKSLTKKKRKSIQKKKLLDTP